MIKRNASNRIFFLTYAISCFIISEGRKGADTINKTIEEIRKETGMSQVDFANAVGMSIRNYQYKLNDTIHNRWLLDEIIRIAKLNQGQVHLSVDGREYDINIYEI